MILVFMIYRKKILVEAQVMTKEAKIQFLEAQLRSQEDANKRYNADLDAMKDSFKVLASEVSKTNAEEFRKQSAGDLANLLNPIKEKFGQFDQTIKTAHIDSVKQNAVLETTIKNLVEKSNQVGEEAKNLANALSGRSKVQGDFGEMLLKDILKNAGLLEGVHFYSQSVMTDEQGYQIDSDEGKVMIPDILIQYPDDTVVVVDSKVSLKAFNSYIAAVSAEQRNAFAKAHIESVKNHIDELKKKDYASYIPEGKRRVDYNIMFIPVEAAFQLMLEDAPTLWQSAKDSNVLIVSQMTLIIVLNMIQLSWKQADQEKNIVQVYKTASELMSQIQGWLENYVLLGDNITKVAKSYEDTKKKLIDSNQSVVKKIEKLESLGLSPKRSNAKLKGASRKTSTESIIPKNILDE